VTTNNRARSRGVDTGGVSTKERVEVVVNSEAGLERTVVVELGLVLGVPAEALVGPSFVGPGPSRATVAGTLVACWGSPCTTVIRSTTTTALVGASSITVANHPVPGSRGVPTIATLTRALQNGLWADDGAGGSLTSDAQTIGEGLDRAKVPAGTALLLVKDEEAA